MRIYTKKRGAIRRSLHNLEALGIAHYSRNEQLRPHAGIHTIHPAFVSYETTKPHEAIASSRFYSYK